MNADREQLDALLAQTSALAEQLYGPGTRARLRALCERCGHAVHSTTSGWAHDSFTNHDAKVTERAVTRVVEPPPTREEAHDAIAAVDPREGAPWPRTAPPQD